MKNTHLLILFSFFIFSGVSFGQDFQLKNITEEQGLSSSTVWTIAQDKDGYIWFGTSAGLDRYDGKEFKHYSTKDGLPENEVLEIFTDVKSNRLYLQTFSNSFCYYENGEIINEKKNKELEKFKSKRTQTKVKFDGMDVNNQFIYTDSTYFLILDSTLKYKEKYNMYNIGELMKFYYYKGQLFALIDDGKNNVILIKAYKNSNYQIVKKWENIYNPELLIKSFVNNMFIIYDERNNIFIYNKEDLKLEKVILAKTEITSVCVDRDSLFWYGKNDGVYYTELLKEGSEHHQILKGIIITNLLEDNLGNLWVGTLDNGVFLLTNKKIKGKKFYLNNRQISINRIVQNNNQLIFGHNNNSYTIGKIFTEKKITTSYDGSNKFNRTIGNILINNKLYLVTEFGIYNKESRSAFIKLNAIKQAILIEPKILLIATARNLIKITLDDEYKVKSQMIIKSIRVSSLQKLNDEIVLFGNLNDLYLYEIKSEKINKLTLPAWCSTVKTNKIVLHKNGDAWILTSNHGILIYHNQVIKKLNDKGIFDEQNLKCISFQNDSVAWVGTETGLYKITYPGNAIKSYEKFEETEGMLSKKINDTYIDHDTLYVASAGGLNYFNIYNYYSNKTFKLVFQELKVSDSLRYSNSFPKVLSPTQTSISISYAGLYYGKTKNLVYYYRLIGSSNNWKSTIESTINFAALKSNKYKIEIYAIDKNNPRIVSNHIYYEFEIEPHYYETLWFYVLIFILIILITIIIALLYNRRQKQKFIAENALNKKMNELELRALQSQLDPHFIFNSINAIKDFLNKHDVESTDKYLDEFAYLIRNTLDNSRHSNILLIDEKKYLNTYLKLEQLRSNNRFVFEITLSKDLQSEILSIPTMMLQPFAENCVRHGNVGSLEYEGNISIHFSLLDENRLKCSIIDNGVGYLVSLNKSNERKSNMRSHALQIQKERIALYNQNAEIKIEFSIEDRTDNVRGTKVEIILPILFYEEVQNHNH